MINVPYTKQLVDSLFQNTDPWAIVFAQIIGEIDKLFLADRLLHSFIFLKL